MTPLARTYGPLIKKEVSPAATGETSDLQKDE